MNGQNEPRQPAKKNDYKGLAIILLACALISCIYVFGRPLLTRWIYSGRGPLDYDSVLLNPGLFNGEACSLDGEVVEIPQVGSYSDKKLSYFYVCEHADPAHVWFVYGEVSPADFQKIKTGSDFSVQGKCEGSFTAVGDGVTYPVIRFYSYKVTP